MWGKVAPYIRFKTPRLKAKWDCSTKYETVYIYFDKMYIWMYLLLKNSCIKTCYKSYNLSIFEHSVLVHVHFFSFCISAWISLLIYFQTFIQSVWETNIIFPVQWQISVCQNLVYCAMIKPYNKQPWNIKCYLLPVNYSKHNLKVSLWLTLLKEVIDYSQECVSSMYRCMLFICVWLYAYIAKWLNLHLHRYSILLFAWSFVG